MGELILINDDNYKDFIGDGNTVDFYGERILNAMPRLTEYGMCAAAPAMRPDQLIPRSEWPDRIRDMDSKGTWLENFVRKTNPVPVNDQNGLGYCHAYSAVMAAQVQRAIQRHPYVELSGESIGGPITGWRNRGANPESDLEQLVQYGACPVSMMDQPYSLNPNRWDSNWEQERLNYRCKEWWDCDIPGKTFDALATCAFTKRICFVGYSWWGHAVTAGYRVVDLGKNKFAIVIRNNWGPNYGDDGFAALQEGKGTPDIGCFSPGLMEAYE